MKSILRCIPLLAVGALAHLTAAPFDVRAYGAKGDGHTLDTAAINQAIDAAAAAGGGTVEFPAGNYLSYTIHLKSHVSLHLGAGATLIAAEPSPDLKVGYDAPEANPGTDQYEDFGHSHWHNSLIVGENLVDIGITGPGEIYGRGLSRGMPGMRRDWLPEERALPADQRPDLRVPAAIQQAIKAGQKTGPFGYPGRDTLPAGVGNKAIALKNCRNVIFRDFTIYHGGHFGILATGVTNWTCDGLKIDTNRDGIDFDGCQNVRVSNCTVNSPYDDGLCLKASYGLGEVHPTENFTMTNCQVSGFDEGTVLDGTRQKKFMTKPGTGRIKLGTEANGGFHNIAISNCVFEYCRGLALEEVDGGSLEDVTISNLTMRDIGNAPIYIRLGARLRGPAPIGPSILRRVKIDNVVAHNVAAQSGVLILGLPDHPIEDVTLSNIFIDYAGGGTAEEANYTVAEDPQGYPEPSNHGHHGTIPAWGMFARHVNNLDLHHIEFRVAKEDLRPDVHLEDVNDVTLEHAKLPHAPGVPAIVAKNVDGLSIQSCPGLNDVAQPGHIDSRNF